MAVNRIVPVPKKVEPLEETGLKLSRTSQFRIAAPEAPFGPVKTAGERVHRLVTDHCTEDALAGEDGLNASYGILMTYFQNSGLAMHGNVFNADDLKKARNEPEKYKNLQVRVCGWNAYFVDLSPTEQDAFIRQAQNNE